MSQESNFNVEKKSGLVIVYCRRNLDAVYSREAVQILREALKDPAVADCQFVLDLADHLEIGPVFMREIMPILKELKERNRKLHVVQAPKSVTQYVRQSGMDGSILVIDTLASLVPAGQSVPDRKRAATIDTGFVNPFLDAALTTLKVQAQITLTPGKPYLKGTAPPPKADIAAVIGLISKSFRGSISICFSEASFLGVMSNMIGEKYEKITPEIEDGAGELLNIIFGQAKRVLNEKGFEIEKAIPTVIRGQDIVIRHLVPSPAIILPFDSSVGPIFIEIGTEQN